jgi:hypothetical protein
MKYFVSLFLIISFVSTGVFSFAFFAHGANHFDNNCLVYTIEGAICPVSGVQGLAEILIPAIFQLFFALVLLFLIPVSIFRLSQNWRYLKFRIDYHRRRFIRWLALLENSPSV